MIKLGIIGCGHWGPNYIRDFNKLANATVSKCCDINQESLNRIKTLYSSIELTKDYKDILGDSEINAVVVATPATTHYKIIKDCLEYEKDVLAEKPLTLIPDESLKLVEIARHKNKILMVGHTFLYNPGIIKLKEYIKNGELGKIYCMNATRTHLGLVRKDVNVVWDLAPHDISIFNYLTDSLPISVSAMGGCYLRRNEEDMAFINLTYPSGIIANIYVSWADSNKERTVKVVGSKARVVFNDMDRLETVKFYEKGIANEEIYDDFGEFHFYLRDGNIISPKIEMVEPLKAMCSHFLECIINRKQHPLSDGVKGYEVVKVMAAIDASLKNKKFVEI